jgi:hypothetical protein
MQIQGFLSISRVFIALASRLYIIRVILFFFSVCTENDVPNELHLEIWIVNFKHKCFFIDLWSLLCLKCCIELQQERRKEYIHVLIQSSHVEQWWLRLLTFPANQYTILISHFTYSELHMTYVGHNLKLSYYICFILNMLRIQPFIPMPVTSCLVIGCSIMWNYLFDLMWHIFLLLAVTFVVYLPNRSWQHIMFVTVIMPMYNFV